MKKNTKRTFMHSFRVELSIIMVLAIIYILIPAVKLIFTGGYVETMGVGEFYLRFFGSGCCLAFAMFCWTEFV